MKTLKISIKLNTQKKDDPPMYTEMDDCSFDVMDVSLMFYSVGCVCFCGGWCIVFLKKWSLYVFRLAPKKKKHGAKTKEMEDNISFCIENNQTMDIYDMGRHNAKYKDFENMEECKIDKEKKNNNNNNNDNNNNNNPNFDDDKFSNDNHSYNNNNIKTVMYQKCAFKFFCFLLIASYVYFAIQPSPIKNKFDTKKINQTINITKKKRLKTEEKLSMIIVLICMKREQSIQLIKQSNKNQAIRGFVVVFLFFSFSCFLFLQSIFCCN